MKTHTQSGFAMLFTVLIISLILSIAVSISNLTLKQTVLSNLAKDSQIAFYQADAAVECGMYEDTTLGLFPVGVTDSTLPQTFYCAEHLMTLNQQKSAPDYFVYDSDAPTPLSPCFKIIFDKTFSDGTDKAKVQGYGYNICNEENPRQVERALEVKY